ncbi:uncharacterized protein LOC142582541 [Dermacentor variabilis]|uniref:uncharacterized protein LOC142582541 n=1 Tax=Dermacentor variabilis TaxID=34621 RepID=UPI003F5BA19B
MNSGVVLVSFCLILFGAWRSSLALTEPFFTHMASCVGEPITAVSVPQKDQAALAAWNNLFRQSAGGSGGSGAAFAQLFHKAKGVATSSVVLLRRWNRCLKAVCVPDTALKSVSCRSLYFSYNPYKRTCMPQKGFCQRTINHFASMEDCRIACTSPTESGRAAAPTMQDTEVRLVIFRKKNGASVTLVNSTLKIPQKKNVFFVGYLLPDPYGPLVGIPKSNAHPQSSVTKVAVKKPEVAKMQAPQSVPKQAWQSSGSGVTHSPQGLRSPSIPSPPSDKKFQGTFGTGPIAGIRPSRVETAPPKSHLASVPPPRPPPLSGAAGPQFNVPSKPELEGTGTSEMSFSDRSSEGKKTASTMPPLRQAGSLVNDSAPGFFSARPPQNGLMAGMPPSLPPSLPPRANAAQSPLSDSSRPQPLPSTRASDSSNASQPRQLSDMSIPTFPPGMVDPNITDEPPRNARVEKEASHSSAQNDTATSRSDKSADHGTSTTAPPASSAPEPEPTPRNDPAKARHARELPGGFGRTRRTRDGMPQRAAPISRRSAREGPPREPVVEEKIVAERAPLTGIRTAYPVRRSLAVPFTASNGRREEGGVRLARWAPRTGSRFPASISL